MAAKFSVVLILKALNQDSTLYRLNKRTTLQFRFDHSLYGQRIEIFCNYPIESGKLTKIEKNYFNRNEYHKVPRNQMEIYLQETGCYRFYFTNGCDDVQLGSGYFIVEPELLLDISNIKHDNNTPSLSLGLDSIQCQTVLSKLLGQFSTWPDKLRVSCESGYNMIHFTPIQELGASNSCYSLNDQLKLNPAFGEGVTFEHLYDLFKKIRTDWKVFSIGDIVLNHTANESTWLLKHPDASYNCMNCPYLRPAYLLDTALARFSMQLSQGVYNITPTTADWTEEHLGTIRHLLQTEVVPALRLDELYVCSVSKFLDEFSERARHTVPEDRASDGGTTDQLLQLLQDKEYRRLQTTIDIDLALKVFNIYRKNCWDEESRLRACIALFKQRLDSLNDTACTKVNQLVQTAIDNCMSHIRYQRVDNAGPRLSTISAQHPLVDRYFTPPRMQTKQKEELDYNMIPWEIMERAAFEPHTASTIMAHNGWVRSGDAEVNFALYPAPVYLQRALIPWCDSVKLNYGSAPKDSPFLWQHMRTYVEQMALLFDGLRLDNCHSTPLHVAEAMIDAARRINDNLYVLAELFTNDPSTDHLFVNRLGITSLVRESMSAWDSRELGRLLHHYGGDPIGSFLPPSKADDDGNEEAVLLVPNMARALLLDQSHDNESVVVRRSARDSVANCALVCMAGCAVGSTRGYDELVPHQINVVTEDRQYAEWGNDDYDYYPTSTADVIVNNSTGIIAARRVLNKLHAYMGANNFTEIYVDQVDNDIVAITRHNPDSQKSILLVAYTAFGSADHNNMRSASLRLDGVVKSIRFESQWHPDTDNEPFIKDPQTINGLTNMRLLLRTDINLEDSEMVSMEQQQEQQHLHLQLTAGSVIVIDIDPTPGTVHALGVIRSAFQKKGAFLNLDSLSLLDLNVLLYRCEKEQRDSTKGAIGAYEIPNYGKLVYCGLQGFISVLFDIRKRNDVGHPLCENLRNGSWMTEYVWRHLLNYSTDYECLMPVTKWLRELMNAVSTLPRYLRAVYFEAVLTFLYNKVSHRASRLQDSLFQPVKDSLRDTLCNVSVQMTGSVPSGPLPQLDEAITVQGTLCAGLPHFTTGYCRNWGRDTFIALRGLHILTGRHEDARVHILAYAACLRHGLIPNLIDGGTKPRYNCRDAVWWWLYCIKCYVLEAKNGRSILSMPVRRLYASNEDDVLQPLHNIIQEALSIHFQGLVFREKGAGPSIDAHMIDAGFTVQIGVHPATGFVFGGNVHNCGTWMDKMGHTGRPATPRDGSAIELVGLQYAVLTWLALEAGKAGDLKYPHDGVTRKLAEDYEDDKTGVVEWTWTHWATKIRDNFERCFWIGENTQDDLINRRSIYKDTYESAQRWPDFQLRCNFPIAMVVAPDLFTPSRASAALRTMQKHLLSIGEDGYASLGVRTLDPSDWNYRPDYDNTDEGPDEATLHGFNYHNGPEWVWPLGYYLRARLLFPGEKGNDAKSVREEIMHHLASHNVHVHGDVWRGLPELTNNRGRYCHDSCRTQAWSAATVLEVLYELQVHDEENQGDYDTHNRVTY